MLGSTAISVLTITSLRLKRSQLQNQPDLWEEIKEQASEMCRHPAYDYGIPFFVFMDFVGDLSKKYSIQLK